MSVKRPVPTTLGLIVSLAFTVNGQHQKPIDSSAGLRQAETAANQIVQQFHRDLDFKTIFDRSFVSDPQLRQKALSFDDAEKWKQFDLPTRERVYVSAMTFFHLWVEYKLIQTHLEVPPEIDRTKNLDLLSPSSPPKTIGDLNREISDVEQLSTIYRKYFPQGAFETAQYRASIAEGIKDAKTNHHNVPRVEKGNAKFGVPATVPVYVVRPEAFDYYFIRENGAMKLFYVDILPNFKLF